MPQPASPLRHPRAAAPRRRTLLGWACASTVAASGLVRAQDTRPVRLIVPFPAGGATDAITRLAAETMTTQLGQPCVVENRPGAAGNIAGEYVARAPADGHTLLVAGQSLLFINKALYRNLSFDPDADFSLVGMLGDFPNVVVSNADALPVHNIAELIALARAKPGTVSYGSNGVGSLSHLTVELMAAEANVKFLHAPYQGAAPQMADLLSGRIGFSAIASQTVMPMIQQKRLRPLAVSTGTRYAELPDVPTLVESGFQRLDAPVWFALMAPSATPAPMLAKLRTAFASTVAAPRYTAGLQRVSALPMQMSTDAALALLARERQLWVEAVRITGATAQ